MRDAPVPVYRDPDILVAESDYDLFSDIVDDLLRIKYGLDAETDPPIQAKLINLGTHNWLPFDPEPRAGMMADEAETQAAMDWALINLTTAADRVKSLAKHLHFLRARKA